MIMSAQLAMAQLLLELEAKSLVALIYNNFSIFFYFFN
jgi:hypothetical protein